MVHIQLNHMFVFITNHHNTFLFYTQKVTICARLTLLKRLIKGAFSNKQDGNVHRFAREGMSITHQAEHKKHCIKLSIVRIKIIFVLDYELFDIFGRKY